MLRRHFNMVSEGGVNYDYAIIYHAPEHNFFLNYPDLQGYWGYHLLDIPEIPFTLIEDSYNESNGIGIWKFKGAIPYVIGPVIWYDGDNSNIDNVISLGGITWQIMRSSISVVGNSFCNITDIIIPNNISIYPGLFAFIIFPALSYIDPETMSIIPNIINTVTMTGSIYCLGAMGYISDIVIPSTVELIYNPLYNTLYFPPSKTITVEKGNRFYDSRENCNALIETSTNKLILASDATTHIPSSITCIGDMAFYRHPRNSIIIPDTVLTMGNGVFIYAESSEIIIPDHIKELHETYVDGLPRGFFEGCTNLKAINLPSQLEVIGTRTFYDCSSLTSVNIPDSVTSIGEYAFSGCSSLTSVTIGNSVTSIGWGAFENCTGLTSVTIPNSVMSIGPWAFEYCSSLTSITIPNSVNSIEDGAFFYCSSLTSVTIGENVTVIGWLAFEGCNHLTSITYNGTQLEWNNIQIGADWNIGVPATVVHCTDGDVTL